MARRSRRRFDAIAEALPSALRLADIGAGDLGLARLALRLGRARHVIAVERASGAFERAAGRACTDGRVEVRLGDGFDPIAPGEVDAAVMAGLGGPAIARILDRARMGGRSVLPHFIVVAPFAQPAAAREALWRCGYRVTDDRIVAEGPRMRLVITAVRGRWGAGAGPRPAELEIGRLLDHRCAEPMRAAYLAERLVAWRREADGAEGQRRRYLVDVIAEVEAAL